MGVLTADTMYTEGKEDDAILIDLTPDSDLKTRKRR